MGLSRDPKREKRATGTALCTAEIYLVFAVNREDD